MRVAEQRKCGDCGACCAVLAVPGLKGENETCPNIKPCGTNRCRIHDKPELPAACSGYRCGWLDGMFKVDDRPDKLGVIFDATKAPGDSYYIVAAREVRPKAAESPRAAELIRVVANEAAVVIVPATGTKRRLVCNSPSIVERLRPLLRQQGLA